MHVLMGVYKFELEVFQSKAPVATRQLVNSVGKDIGACFARFEELNIKSSTASTDFWATSVCGTVSVLEDTRVQFEVAQKVLG